MASPNGKANKGQIPRDIADFPTRFRRRCFIFFHHPSLEAQHRSTLCQAQGGEAHVGAHLQPHFSGKSRGFSARQPLQHRLDQGGLRVTCSSIHGPGAPGFGDLRFGKANLKTVKKKTQGIWCPLTDILKWRLCTSMFGRERMVFWTSRNPKGGPPRRASYEVERGALASSANFCFDRLAQR